MATKNARRTNCGKFSLDENAPVEDAFVLGMFGEVLSGTASPYWFIHHKENAVKARNIPGLH
jgi:hypothetical protein